MTSASLEALQNDWKQLYQQTLPTAARAKAPSQTQWPVVLDHCFARIILDAVIGKDTPWTSKIKSPAYRNMSATQLQQSIVLGNKILQGGADLVVLDQRSLAVRGKTKGTKRKAAGNNEAGDQKRRELSLPATPKKAVPTNSSKPSPTISPFFSRPAISPQASPTTAAAITNLSQADLKPYLSRIALSDLTPFRKRVLTALCQVPPGHYTTYGAMARYLASSPRAVGNALRNNPYAPQVPCHRVLASGGGIGGFGGSWGRKGVEGVNDGKKRGLLREEGVAFDGLGKVVGGVWEEFQ